MVPLTSKGFREEKILVPVVGIELRTFQTVSYSLYQLMQPGVLSPFKAYWSRDAPTV
jgi:hypothetical protein